MQTPGRGPEVTCLSGLGNETVWPVSSEVGPRRLLWESRVAQGSLVSTWRPGDTSVLAAIETNGQHFPPHCTDKTNPLARGHETDRSYDSCRATLPGDPTPCRER